MIEIGDDELLIERELDAPVALVFRLWESRDHMLRWWGPEGFTATELDWALVPGRPWRGAMVSDRFGVSRFGGVIREVERDRRIVFTFRWDTGSGEDIETIATVTLAAIGSRTIQTFHQAPFASVTSRDSHVGGWTSLFDKQRNYAGTISLAAQKGRLP